MWCYNLNGLRSSRTLLYCDRCFHHSGRRRRQLVTRAGAIVEALERLVVVGPLAVRKIDYVIMWKIGVKQHYEMWAYKRIRHVRDWTNSQLLMPFKWLKQRPFCVNVMMMFRSIGHNFFYFFFLGGGGGGLSSQVG